MSFQCSLLKSRGLNVKVKAKQLYASQLYPFQNNCKWNEDNKKSRSGKGNNDVFSSSGVLTFSSVLTGVTGAVITAGQSLIPSVLVLIVTTRFTFRLIVLIVVGSNWTRLASCRYVPIVTFMAN